MARAGREGVARARGGRRAARDDGDRPGRCVPVPPRHRAPRDGGRGHADRGGLDPAPGRRGAAR